MTLGRTPYRLRRTHIRHTCANALTRQPTQLSEPSLCVQSLRLLIQANAALESQYAAIFSELEQATDARLFPATIVEFDQKIRKLVGGE